MADRTTAAAARLSERVAAIEARVTRDAVAALDEQLDAIIADLRTQAPTWRGDPAAALRGRRALAARVRKVRPGVAAVIRSALDDAVAAGAGDVDVDVKARTDALVDQVVKAADAAVRRKAATVARRILTEPVRTDAQVARLADRVAKVSSPGAAAASTAVVRAADAGAAEAAGDRTRVWVSRPDCCVHCAGFTGATAAPGELFHPVIRVEDRPLPWAVDGVPGPPLHDHCRCVAPPTSTGLAAAVRKRAAADVAAGRVGYASAPARGRAARRLLRTRAPLTPAARRQAAKLARTVA